MTSSFGFVALFLCSLWVVGSSCEQPFEPVRENERHFFSINGYLDVSADTQWVRVMPVRETIGLSPGLPVPVVALEHLQSGQLGTMRDSLFRYAGNRYAYIFWSTMQILPGERYRISVTDSAGRNSYAEVTLPQDFPVPQFSEPEFGADILTIRQVERLADVQVVYRILYDETGKTVEVSFPFLQQSVFIPPSTYRVSINPDFGRSMIREMYCGITVTERNVFVASGGPEWVDFFSLDRHTIALPEGVSNIENGVGYFGGILSKTFPYVNSEGDRGLFQVPCPS
ncbi:hypothetical protein [Halalkalibaculum sp. DA384]|uniref:hypothetical protein n=1 Tax=Halalkalibaculum sp. DA384 TaxID=3373606 RepID=UPI003754EBD5